MRIRSTGTQWRMGRVRHNNDGWAAFLSFCRSQWPLVTPDLPHDQLAFGSSSTITWRAVRARGQPGSVASATRQHSPTDYRLGFIPAGKRRIRYCTPPTLRRRTTLLFRLSGSSGIFSGRVPSNNSTSAADSQYGAQPFPGFPLIRWHVKPTERVSGIQTPTSRRADGLATRSAQSRKRKKTPVPAERDIETC